MIRLFSLVLLLAVFIGVGAQDATTITTENADSLTRTLTLAGHEFPVNDLAFSPDGTTLASAADDLTTRLWDVSTGELATVFEGQLQSVRSVGFSPDGNTLVTTSFNGFAFLWDVRSVTRAAGVEADGLPSMSDAEFAPDGDTFAVALGTGAVASYDRATGEPQTVYPGPAGALLVERVAFAPDGSLLAAGYGFPVDAALVWDAATGEALHTLSSGEGTVYGLAFSPDGKTLALGGGLLTVYEITPGAAEQRYQVAAGDGGVLDLAFSPDGALIATAGFDGAVRLWDAATGEALAVLRGTDAPRSVLAVAFSPDGSTLAAAGEAAEIWLWEPTP